MFPARILPVAMARLTVAGSKVAGIPRKSDPPRPAWIAAPEAPEGRHSLSRIAGTAAPVDRQHWHHGRGRGEWNARKHGGPKRRVRRKIRLGIGEKTPEIRAAECTSSDLGDAPMLPEPLDPIPADQDIASVTADGAFGMRRCHDASVARGAAAIMPPRKNAKPWVTNTAAAIIRSKARRASRRFGKAIWRRRRGYHRLGRVERCKEDQKTVQWTVFPMIGCIA
ncbi:Transposase DDE domain-containing protein [Paracoccus pantotrophus]|nr:Transposase DDE domain-containing protein [Paracoccus pantotrophus]